MYRSADHLWRIEQAAEIRLYSRSQVGASWTHRYTCRSPGELAQWLKAQGDPVERWIED